MLTVELVREKETKRTVRYTEDAEEPKIGTLYVPKATLAQLGDPATLSITLEPAHQLAAAA